MGGIARVLVVTKAGGTLAAVVAATLAVGHVPDRGKVGDRGVVVVVAVPEGGRDRLRGRSDRSRQCQQQHKKEGDCSYHIHVLNWVEK